jgi:hypothetical protein
MRDFRFGSKADIPDDLSDVRFTPKSGHWNSIEECPLCAISRHRQAAGAFGAKDLMGAREM